jgi:ribulose-phosphate 3-epimerase
MMQYPMTLAPSILAADFARLGEEVLACEAAGAAWIHIDVMDGRFVPNISMGLVVVEALRRVTRLPLDVHLMIVEPEKYLADFALAGATHLSIHAEATPHVHRALQRIRELGLKAGLAINPGTPLEAFTPLLDQIDLALLMTVNPGFGGQTIATNALERLRQLRAMCSCLIEVDGGVTQANAAELLGAGADVLVAGSAIFKGNIAQNIQGFYAAAG